MRQPHRDDYFSNVFIFIKCRHGVAPSENSTVFKGAKNSPYRIEFVTQREKSAQITRQYDVSEDFKLVAANHLQTLQAQG